VPLCVCVQRCVCVGFELGNQGEEPREEEGEGKIDTSQEDKKAKEEERGKRSWCIRSAFCSPLLDRLIDKALNFGRPFEPIRTKTIFIDRLIYQRLILNNPILNLLYSNQKQKKGGLERAHRLERMLVAQKTLAMMTG
jgi:hypothetical protein